MSDCEAFWSKVPDEAIEPTRVKLLEALCRVGQPLSAIQLVNLLDGEVSMEEAAGHLSALEVFGVVERVEGRTSEDPPRDDGFDVPYRLEDEEGDGE